MLKTTLLILLFLGLSSSQFLTFLEDPEKIELYRASSTKTEHYGVTSISKSFSILTSTGQKDKSVFVHLEKVDGTWEDVEAKKVDEFTQNGEKYQMWNANFYWTSTSGNKYNQGNNFALRLTTDHCVQWDNNNSQNYNLQIHAGTMLGREVNLAVVYASLKYISHQGQTMLYASLDVKNLAPEKKVFALYTTDDWTTSKRIEAQYSNYYFPSYAEAIPSPNDYGVELWNISEAVSEGKTEQIKVVFGYEVNNMTYWDNNFGRIYTINAESY